MNNRIWAWIVLIIFITGLGLGFYSVLAKNPSLSTTAVIFIVAGVLGTFAIRRRVREQEAEARPHLPQENAAEPKISDSDSDDSQ